jgi:ribosomal protein S18 acetylase RimI-like enzyme
MSETGPTLKIRSSTPDDQPFLERMLFEAFFWDAAVRRPTLAECRSNVEFTKLLEAWGRRGDRAVIAEDPDRPVGAAWYRMWTAERHSYGFVDAAIPELGIGVLATHRRRGVGRLLMQELIAIARSEGWPALSLSVAPSNPARVLYEALGFERVGEAGTSWTYCKRLDSS